MCLGLIATHGGPRFRWIVGVSSHVGLTRATTELVVIAPPELARRMA